MKSTLEIHHAVEGDGVHIGHEDIKLPSLWSVVCQIAIIDIVFSFDTVMNCQAGMSDHFTIMAFAVIAAVVVMIFAAEPVSNFVEAHPTVKMLALKPDPDWSFTCGLTPFISTFRRRISTLRSLFRWCGVTQSLGGETPEAGA